MIKIVVDTEEELNYVRRVLHIKSCSHSTCSKEKHSQECAECVEKYCNGKVVLYKKEIVEIPAPIVV